MHRKRNRQLMKRLRMIFLAGVILLTCVPFAAGIAKADYVTDSIGVMVGYPGMALDEYVLVGDYHISEIEANLPVYEYAYSFFQKNTVEPAKYKYIVDSARGILISDLLDYAKVYYGDIYNLQFWVQDHNGMWCAFDRDELFAGNRYYFNNLPGHRKIIYKTFKKLDAGIVSLSEALDEEDAQVPEPQDSEPNDPEPDNPEQQVPEPQNLEPNDLEPDNPKPEEEETITDYSVILGYDFSECWNDCSAVPPMLAIEDNWVTYTEEFESAGPDYSYLNTGSRFRLLYGQYEPTASDTRDSAKWVRYVYVTLAGKPKFGDLPDLNGEYGTHTIDLPVEDMDNEDLRDNLSEYLNLYSTNEDVLVIKKIEIKKDQDYSDLATVRVQYEIVGDGEASIGGGFGVNDEQLLDGSGQGGLNVNTEDFNQPGKKDPDKKDDKGKLSEKPAKDNPEKGAKPGQDSKDQKPDDPDTGNKPDSASDPDSAFRPSDNTASEKPAVTDQDNQPETAEHKVAEAAPEVLEAAQGKTIVYQLSEDMKNKLDERLKEQAAPIPQAQADTSITEVLVEDKTEEKENRRKLILVWTGLGSLGLCVLGGMAEYAGFRMRLKKAWGRKQI